MCFQPGSHTYPSSRPFTSREAEGGGVVRVGGDDGELRQWHYIYVYSIGRGRSGVHALLRSGRLAIPLRFGSPISVSSPHTELPRHFSSDSSHLSVTLPLVKNNFFAETCSDSEEGSYLRVIDFYITQL